MELILDVISIVVGLATVTTLFLVYAQMNRQRKKEKLELVLALFREFYQNDKFKQIFELIDQENLEASNEAIFQIVFNGQEFKELREIDFNVYFNFFNSLALLVEENVIESDTVMRVFRYQLEKTFSINPLIQYAEQYGFESVLNLLPNRFFFYGKLRDDLARRSIPEIRDIQDYLYDDVSNVQLNGFVIEDVVSDTIYKGMVRTKNQSSQVLGSFVRIKEPGNWHRILTNLDDYEEVPYLYERVIIQIPKSKWNKINRGSYDYVWAYLKKSRKLDSNRINLEY
jgi:hypothetical protein